VHGEDTELEVIVIPEAESLSLDGLDLIVDALHLAAGDSVVVVGQDFFFE